MEVLMHDLLIPKFQECPRAWHITAYQSCYLTPCCGLGVQKPTQAIKSVKGTGNTFDLNPNWARICRWEFFMGYLEKPPPLHKKIIQIPKHSIPDQTLVFTIKTFVVTAN
jgi:hypothetical protein